MSRTIHEPDVPRHVRLVLRPDPAGARRACSMTPAGSRLLPSQLWQGVAVARRLCVDNGNPPPYFAFGPSHVLATVRAAR